MATAIPFPGWQTSANGTTLASGAKIYFYVPGTAGVTLRTPFSDTALTVPTTNPVILNSSGWPSTNIYLDASLAYEYRVMSADDAVTYVPLTTIPAGASGDATLVAIGALTISDGDYIQGTGTDTFRARKLTVATYAALTAIVAGSRFDDMLVYVASRTTDGDGGEGYWRFDAGSSATANGGTILAPDAGTGRWTRIYTAVVLLDWFGSDATAFSAGLAVSIAANLPFDLCGGEVTLGTSGIITTLLEGEVARVRNGTINGAAVTASQVLGSGVTSIFVWGVVAKDGSDRDMWNASYAKATLTGSAARGATTLAVDDTSSLTPDSWIIIHDTTKVWDSDNSIQSEAHLVLSRSTTSGAGTITLAGILDHDYTTSATVRRWVAAELHTENIKVIGAGTSGTQDGITTLNLLRRSGTRDVIEDCYRRAFADYNALSAQFYNCLARNCYEDGFGYGFIANGSILQATTDCVGENARIVQTAGKGASSSQMTRLQRAIGLSGYALTENIIDAHPGVYEAQWSQLSAEFRTDVDVSGDAVVFSGTHLSLDGLRLGQTQRSGVTVYRYGHLLPSNDGARIFIANVNVQPNASDLVQYGFFYDDSTAGSNKQDKEVIIRDCDFTSNSGCVIKNRVCTVENLQISGSRLVSVSATNGVAGRGLTMDSLTAGGVANMRSLNNVYGANSSALTLDAALFARRTGASLAVQSIGDRVVGEGRHGLVISYGVLKYFANEMPGSGYTGNAVQADTGGTLTAL